TTIGQLDESDPLNSVPSSTSVCLDAPLFVSLISRPPVPVAVGVLRTLRLHDLHAQAAPRFECERGVVLRLLDGADQGAAGSHDELVRADDAGALPLEEFPVDGDVAGAGDLHPDSTPSLPTTSSVPCPSAIVHCSKRLSISTLAPPSNSSDA